MTTNEVNESVDRSMQTTGLTKRGFTEEEAAFYIGVSRSFLRQSRMDGVRENRVPGPRYIKIGTRMIRYLHEDLDTWLDQYRQADGEIQNAG